MASLFRRLTHQALQEVPFSGVVLDLGGSKTSEYMGIVTRTAASVQVLNLDPKTQPDVFADLEKPLPCTDASYDTVLAMNVLEHIFHYQQLLDESFRVLRPGGEMVIVVPFLFQVHPSPNDFFRFTREALMRLLSETGFTSVTVKEIGTGPRAVRHQMMHNFLPDILRGMGQWMAMQEDYQFARLAAMLGKVYPAANYPLGYLVRAKKAR